MGLPECAVGDTSCQERAHNGIVDLGYTQVIGTARTSRLEKALYLGMRESMNSILPSRLRMRSMCLSVSGRTRLAPDYEYIIVNGTVQVSRYFPLSLKQRLLAAPTSPFSRESDVSNKMAFGIQERARVDLLVWAP